jgi:hypothetical protein
VPFAVADSADVRELARAMVALLSKLAAGGRLGSLTCAVSPVAWQQTRDGDARRELSGPTDADALGEAGSDDPKRPRIRGGAGREPEWGDCIRARTGGQVFGVYWCDFVEKCPNIGLARGYGVEFGAGGIRVARIFFATDRMSIVAIGWH